MLVLTAFSDFMGISAYDTRMSVARLSLAVYRTTTILSPNFCAFVFSPGMRYLCPIDFRDVASHVPSLSYLLDPFSLTVFSPLLLSPLCFLILSISLRAIDDQWVRYEYVNETTWMTQRFFFSFFRTPRIYVLRALIYMYIYRMSHRSGQSLFSTSTDYRFLNHFKDGFSPRKRWLDLCISFFLSIYLTSPISLYILRNIFKES